MTRIASANPTRQRPRRSALRLAERRCAVVFAGIIALWSYLPVAAQEPPVPEKGAAKPSKPAVDLTPQHLELITKDRVTIHCEYYPGMNDKQTVPIILVHGWDGPRGPGAGQDLASLARQLQKVGHAVAVPDLRGHGRSRLRQVNDETVTIDRNQMRPADVKKMILDVEAVRSFLVEQNNAGRLNIELLCVIGFEMGSITTLDWIDYDWSVPSWPAFKQGQDVKAFVLVSPEQTFKGITTRRALGNPIVRGNLSAMIILGKDDPKSSTGRRLYNSLKRSHRSVPSDPEQAKIVQDLFLVELDTSLRGTKLLASHALNMMDNIQPFIQRRLVDRQDTFPWRDRSRR